jgi:hypothetical protein
MTMEIALLLIVFVVLVALIFAKSVQGYTMKVWGVIALVLLTSAMTFIGTSFYQGLRFAIDSSMRADARALKMLEQKDAEALEAAQEHANLFLDAVRSEDRGFAFGLLSKGYRERLPAPERDVKKMDVSFPLAGAQRPTEWKLRPGKLLDHGQRAEFEGSASLKDGPEHSFRLIVVRDGAPWRWRVEQFTVER